jgi:hypothetical protein
MNGKGGSMALADLSTAASAMKAETSGFQVFRQNHPFTPKNTVNDPENFSTYPKNFSALTLTFEKFSGKFF